MPRPADIPALDDLAYSPPIIPGSSYGYRAITRISPELAKVIDTHAALVANPDADLSGLNEETATAVLEGRHAAKLVMDEAMTYWQGMLDARCGSKDAKAPEERGGIMEVQYLRGFIDGHLGPHAPKYDFRPRQPSRSPQAVKSEHEATPEDVVYSNVTGPSAAAGNDHLSVHSSGTDIPMPDTPFLSMAALVGYDERDGSPTSFQRYVMDEASYNGQRPPPDERLVTFTLDGDSIPAPAPFIDPLSPWDFRPAPLGVAPRPARHFLPKRGPFEAHAIPEIPLPEGVDRESITKDWDPSQRSALFDYDGEVAWMESEDKELPASAHQLAEAFIALAAVVFPGESPPRPVIPFRNADGVRPNSIAVIGTRGQLDHLTTSGTWATSWVCAQFFPNEPRPMRFVCTFGGLRLRLHEHQKARRMIRSAIEDSEEVAELAAQHGLDIHAALDTLELQHLQDGLGTEMGDLWNVAMSPPSEDPVIQTIWRLTIAGLRPRDPLRGELVAYAHPFKCRTCGCLTHPRRLCPTATTPGWTGTMPRWNVRKALWGRKSSSGARVKIRDARGETIFKSSAHTRSKNKTATSKKHKKMAVGTLGSLRHKRLARRT